MHPKSFVSNFWGAVQSLAFFVDVFMFIVVCSIGELFIIRLGRQSSYRSRLLMPNTHLPRSRPSLRTHHLMYQRHSFRSLLFRTSQP